MKPATTYPERRDDVRLLVVDPTRDPTLPTAAPAYAPMGAATADAATLRQSNFRCRPRAMFAPCVAALVTAAVVDSCAQAGIPLSKELLCARGPTPAPTHDPTAEVATAFQENLS